MPPSSSEHASSYLDAMALSEITMNSAGWNGRGLDSPTTSILRAYADSGSEVGATPSSIQSMLKNTTETGEIGLFSIRPARLPYAISQVSPRTSSLPHIPDGLPQHQLNQLSRCDHLRRRHVGNGRLHSLQSFHGTTTSSIISLYQSESQKSFCPRTTHNTINEQRTFSMSRSSQFGHSLSSHRSYTALRPRSPFAYPTRLKRPGYRPSSPALTDFNGTDARTRLGLEQGMSFRTPSTISIYAPRREPTGHPPAMNRSMPSLHGPSSPFPGSQGRALKMPSVPFRTPTMRQLPYQKTGSQPHEFHRGTWQGGVWSHSQPPSPMPLYYDYSEAFEEQHHLNSPNISVLSSAEQVESENRPPGDSVELKATEIQLENMPLDCASGLAYKSPNRSHSVVESPSPVSAPNNFLKQMSEWEREQISTQDSIKEFGGRQETRSAIESQDYGMEVQHKQGAQGPASDERIGHHILSSSRPQTRDRFIKCSSRTISDVPTLHKSAVQEVPEVGIRNARVPPEVVTDVSHGLHSSTPHLESHSHVVDWEIPSLSFGPLDLNAGGSGTVGCQSNQNVTSAPSLNADRPAIQAPVPKRSSSSRNEGDRFSRILSIDEGFAELARAVLDSGLRSDATHNTSLYGDGRSESHLHQNSRPTKLSSALSPSACDSTDLWDKSSFIQRHQDEPRNEWMQRAVPFSCNVTPIRAVEVLTQVHVALPELQQTGSPLAQPEEAPKPEQSTNVNLVLLGSTADAGPSGIGHEYDAPPETSKNSSAARVHHSTVGHRKLPHAAPALAESKDETATKALLEAASIVPWEYDELKNDDAFPIIKDKLRTQSEGASRGPPLRPRPSDVNVNHHRTGQFEKRGPSLPNPLNKPQASKAKAPKFKLQITRASSSTNGTVRVTLSPTSSPRHSFGTTFDLFQEGPSRRRSEKESTSDGNPPTANLVAERRSESEGDSSTTQTPQISVRPPSPTLQFADVRSFFSDDSSNVEQKSSLRQRLSQLKVIAHKGNSTDELRNSDLRQAGSAVGQAQGSKAGSTRHYRYSSVQSGGTARGTLNANHTRWKLGGRLRSWWHCGEDKLKGLGKKMKKGRKKRSVSSDLYAGV